MTNGHIKVSSSGFIINVVDKLIHSKFINHYFCSFSTITREYVIRTSQELRINFTLYLQKGKK